MKRFAKVYAGLIVLIVLSFIGCSQLSHRKGLPIPTDDATKAEATRARQFVLSALNASVMSLAESKNPVVSGLCVDVSGYGEALYEETKGGFSIRFYSDTIGFISVHGADLAEYLRGVNSKTITLEGEISKEGTAAYIQDVCFEFDLNHSTNKYFFGGEIWYYDSDCPAGVIVDGDQVNL